jgi:hypothetical protein
MNKLHTMRDAFSMITALFIIILMATASMLVLNMSGKMVKETTAQFQREQAMLLANSYTEYTLLAVTANEHNTTNCLNSISGTYGDYAINVNISYIAKSTENTTNCATVLSSSVTTESTPLQVIVDVNVRYPDYDQPDDLNMTYHKRSLLKI